MTRWHKMTRSWLSHHALGVLLLCALSSCSTLPSKYVEQAEPGVILTALTTSPQQFRDKVVILDGPEAGHFWVTAANRDQLPARYRKWARMTIVGHVIGATESEPVLMLMYIRGWDTSGNNDDVWEESVDPAYLPTIPEGLHGEFQTQ